jgi:hypothetical protein
MTTKPVEEDKKISNNWESEEINLGTNFHIIEKSWNASIVFAFIKNEMNVTSLLA